MINHPNRNLLRARKAFPGDVICILVRDVTTSIGILAVGTEITPISAGRNNITGKNERVWSVGGARATYIDH